MVVERDGRGVRGVRDDEPMIVLHDLEFGSGARCV